MRGQPTDRDSLSGLLSDGAPSVGMTAISLAFGLLFRGYSSDRPPVTSVNLKLKYASAAFAVVLLATAAVIGFGVWRHRPDLLTTEGVSVLAVLGSLAAAVVA